MGMNKEMREKLAMQIAVHHYSMDVSWDMIDEDNKERMRLFADEALSLETETHRIAEIKKVGELPEYIGSSSMIDRLTALIAEEVQQDMLKAGYVQEG